MKECFTKEAIANFLGMTEEEVSDSIRRGVNIYKKNFDKLIDGNTDTFDSALSLFSLDPT